MNEIELTASEKSASPLWAPRGVGVEVAVDGQEPEINLFKKKIKRKEWRKKTKSDRK